MSTVFNPTTVSIETLNAIRDAASPLYQSYVPAATQSNIADVGEALWEYDPTFNEFTTLLNKIALTMTIKRMFENPLARFKSGSLDTAATIEEYYIHKVKSAVQDPSGSNPLSRRVNEISKAYYSENRSETYATTTSFKQIRHAFRSRDGVEKLMNELVNELYNSAEIDEYEIMKTLLAQIHTKATVYEVPDPASSAAAARRFVKTIRKASTDLTRPSHAFHTYFVEDEDAQSPTFGEMIRSEDIIQYTPRSNQVLFMNGDAEAEVSVEVLATVFNQGAIKGDLSQIIVGDFGDVEEGIVAILADDRLLRVFDTYRELLTQTNAQGAFINHFLHIDQILALSPFANVIVFKMVEEDNGDGGE